MMKSISRSAGQRGGLRRAGALHLVRSMVAVEIVASLEERVITLSQEMAPPLLIMEAIRLTFGAPPVAADPSSMVHQLGD